MKRIVITIVMMLGFIGLRGCSTAPIGAKPDVVNEYPKIAFNTESLAEAVKMNPPVVGRSATGMLMVTQPIRNASDEVLYIEYRFIWKDATGRPVGPDMSWRYMRLEPRLNDVFSANASSDAVSDYQIQMRWARR